MKKQDLAGLRGLVRNTQADIICLQEVNLMDQEIREVAESMGMEAVVISRQQQPRRTIATMAKSPMVARDLQEGHAQVVTTMGLTLINIHAPAGSDGQRERERLFQAIAQEVQAEQALLIGDFNCVLQPQDTQLWEAHKYSRELDRIVAREGYLDAFRQLHPQQTEYTWSRRGLAASRLDRLYLPSVLGASPRLVQHIPTTSDHMALHVALDPASLGLRPPDRSRGPSFYWKLNVALLQEERFLPAFQRSWQQLVTNTKIPTITCPAQWWEEVAKPAIRGFCLQFGKQEAERRKLSCELVTRALAFALEEGDWDRVEHCRARLQEHNLAEARGLSVRARCEMVEGELPSVFLLAREGRHGRSPGLMAVKKADGTVVDTREEVEEEVTSFFETLFQGRHAATADRPEPYDTGTPFVSDEGSALQFLEGLPGLHPEQREALEQPFTIQELEQAVQGAESNKAPGLDGLSYEFYKRTFASTGSHLLEALNEMLRKEQLTESLRRGVVRLLPKVQGVPKVEQLRPITLLSVDYKLLTKMLVARLVEVLPTVITSSQLCSIKGRSIFDGAAAVLSAADYLAAKGRPGFLVSLDLFHAYDRVSLPWVDRVLEAMGFGPKLRRAIWTLHKGAMATFMLHGLSPDVAILFSIRQGDPVAMILYVLQIEPLLFKLSRVLHGLRVGPVLETALGYVDDVATLGDKDQDLVVLDEVMAAFERASGAILNRNRKSVIVGLGTWETREDWPIPWLQVAQEVKLYGVTVTAAHKKTVDKTWDRVVGGVEQVLRLWATRDLPTLSMRARVLEMFALSKLWYIAQILPLTRKHLVRTQAAAGAFLWRGSLERLPYQELHQPSNRGGLGLTHLATRAEALLAKQACHRISEGGNPRAHISYWLGLSLRRDLPDLRQGLNAEFLPGHWVALAKLLQEVLRQEEVEADQLWAVTAKDLYKSWVSTPPHPKIEQKMADFHFNWTRIWARLSWVGLPPRAVDIAYRAINNVLPLADRRHRLALVDAPACLRCGAQIEDTLHFFTGCTRVHEAWGDLAQRAVLALGRVVGDRELLYLNIPSGRGEGDTVLSVVTFIEMVWATRAEPGNISVRALQARIKAQKWVYQGLY
jgi:exonuclease III